MARAFSDLDGTFLDHHTYACDGALEGYRLLAGRSIPLIFVSSKTFDEMAGFSDQLGHTQPFIFENGAGRGQRDDAGNWICTLNGADYVTLCDAAPLLRKAAGHEIQTFEEMSAHDVAVLTGLSVEQAAQAKKRRGSLPFIFPGDNETDPAEMNRILEPHGFTCTRGGRLYHFSSQRATKGAAVKEMIALGGGTDGATMAVGDSPNDIPMLDSVDYPYIVKRFDGSYIEGRHYIRTEASGPAGFTQAVKHFLDRIDE